jgi:hypothetical protein
MKVECIHHCRVADCPGDIIDIPTDEAKELIELGLVKKVTTKKKADK